MQLLQFVLLLLLLLCNGLVRERAARDQDCEEGIGGSFAFRGPLSARDSNQASRPYV